MHNFRAMENGNRIELAQVQTVKSKLPESYVLTTKRALLHCCSLHTCLFACPACALQDSYVHVYPTQLQCSDGAMDMYLCDCATMAHSIDLLKAITASNETRQGEE